MTRRFHGALIGSVLLALVTTACTHSASNAPARQRVGDLADGKLLFETNCATCHGAGGTEGGVGPSLRAESRRKNLDATIAWIHHPQPPMPQLYPSPLSEDEVIDIASYVQSL